MKIVKIYGGLGNALFQICYAMYLNEKTDHEVKFDFSGLNQDYVDKMLFIISFLDVDFKECSWLERFKCSHILSKGRPKGKELSFIKFINPNDIYYETTWGNLPATTYDYFFGYFQNSTLSTQYSKKITAAVEKLNEKHSLQSENKVSSAFLHVRRGDYLTEKALKVHGKLELDYYKRAIAMLGIQQFDIFTNDAAWVEKNFKGICEFNIKSTNSNFQYPDIEDLYLMSKYNTGIIANSTFSYWAALLGDNQNKRIIYPAKWFEDPTLQQRFYKLKPDFWEAL